MEKEPELGCKQKPIGGCIRMPSLVPRLSTIRGGMCVKAGVRG